jgi:hypothetical protein
MPIEVSTLTALTAAETQRFKSCPVKCKLLQQRITSLADYFAAIGGVVSGNATFWFRGHSEPQWGLTPGALRPTLLASRRRALDLMSDFKRIAEAKLSRLPEPDDEFKWAQIAQHYGLPTRLLDWTESAITALYSASLGPKTDGLVFVMNPIELNRLSDPSRPRILDPQSDRALILRYLKRGPSEGKTTRSYPVAVNPVWSSERLIVQKGTFTLHGSMFSLDKAGVSSLVRIPIMKEYKPQLRSELRRVGVDEMTLFPELEHSCKHLRMWSGLLDFD